MDYIEMTHLLANNKRCAGQSLDSSANNVRPNLQEDCATTCRPVEPESVRHNSTFQGVVEPESVGLDTLKVDELLERLSCACCASPQELALRAVVELHRPEKGEVVVLTSYENGVRKEVEVPACIGCGYNGEHSTWEETYPCPTIQAIEENLK